MKKILSVILVACMILSLFCMTISADSPELAGDVNGDGKVTPFDALQVQAYLHGEITLTDAQIAAAIAACPAIEQLSTAHVVAIYFKPLVGQSSEAPEEDGMYHIRTPLDFAKLRAFPYAAFSLDNDIDMAQASWTPSIFYGYLLGNGHTISNLTITAAKNNVNAGALFVKLGSANFPNATVSNLKLESPTLTTASTHKYAGLVCGSNYGVISDVTISNGALAGEMNGTTNLAGAITGMNYGRVSVNGNVECDFGFSANTAYYVGANSGGSTAYSGTANFTNGEVTLMNLDVREPVAMDRQAVVNTMYGYSQVKWKSPKACTVKESDVTFKLYKYNNYNLYPDYYYTGLPYSHALGSMDAFMDNVDSYDSSKDAYLIKNNSFIVDPSDDSTEYLDSIFLGHIMGMDCSSAVLSAWRTVCTNATAQATNSLVPTASNMNNYGLVKVGNYDIPNSRSASKVISNIPDYSTSWDVNYTVNKSLEASARTYLYCSVVSNDDGTVNQEKLDNLYAAYAACQPGDAIDSHCTGYINSDGSERAAGHARLVSAMPYVVYDNEGKIDPVNSYLTTIEQGGGGGGINSKASNGAKGNENANRYSSWGVNIRYSFQELAGIELATAAKPNYMCYVPVTMPQLSNSYREPAQFKLVNSTSPFTGIVSSNYGITYTEVKVDSVTDRQFTGRFVKGTKNADYEGKDESGFISNANVNINRVQICSVNLAKHAAKFASLASGEHTYSITVKLATGETKTYSGSFITE